MDIQTDIPLKAHSTLHIGGTADYFAEVRTAQELREAINFARERNIPWHVIGEGSNILFDDRGVRGLVIKNCVGGIQFRESEEGLEIEAGAGVIWDTLVAEVALRGWWGFENLSAIPGTVGATPVQNVGAYGVEVEALIREVDVYDAAGDTQITMERDACGFGYRHSIFKEEAGANLVILRVRFFLPRGRGPELAYRDLALRFEGVPPETLTPQEVRDAVTLIRRGKFPNWHEIGTAGSFFKNPIVSQEVFDALRTRYPALVGNPHEGKVKIALGWILEHVCALRGTKIGTVGTYKGQALVLVADEGATADDVVAFANHVAACVFEKTNLTIAWEVTHKK